MVLASGSRVAVRYSRERVRNTTPAGIATPVTNIAAVADGGGAGLSKFTRATGSFIDDGFAYGQRVQAAGFADTDINANWRVASVTATDLVVEDASDVIGDEAAATAQSVRILMIKLRTTGRNINLEKNILESAEVDEDGQETDSRHGFNRVVGTLGFQLSRADYDDFFEFVMGGVWTSVAVTGTPDLGTDSTGSGTSKFVRSAGSFINDGFRPGDVVRSSSFAANNNGDWRVISVAALELVVYDGLDVITTQAAAGGRSLTYPGKRLDIEPDFITIVLERAFLDVLKFQVFNGGSTDQMALNIQPEAMIGGSFSILGMSAAALSGTPLSSVAALEASGNSPFAAFDGEIFEGALPIAVATSAEFTLARNRSLDPVIGSRFSPDVFEGTARVNGTLTAYFQDEVLFNKFVNETESTMWFRLDDPNDSTHFISLVFPRIKYNGANMDPPQQGPVPMEMPFRALKKTGLASPGSTTNNTFMTIQRSNT